MIHFNTIHGHASDINRSRTYRTWEAMKQRCTNPNHMAYSLYGGRGISFDPSWNSFISFLSDMGERPIGKTLDRIDNSKGYFKENCRWATNKEQQTNLSVKTTPHKDSKSGVVGVCFSTKDKCWLAYGRRNGKTKSLYRGASFTDACNLRQQWEQSYRSI